MTLKKKTKVRIKGKLVQKTRVVYNPDKILRVLQYRILTRILEKVPVPDYIHAFEKGKTISRMAQQHVGKQVVISLDLSDYFPSIKQYMLEELFIALGFGQKPANLLSELTTYTSFVPQGSLTAPKLSNLIAAGTFGPEIKEFCDKHGLTLSIYADDITISYNTKLNTKEENREFARSIINTVTEIVRKFKFSINTRKTKVMYRNHRQWVCGAVVNEKVNMRKTERLALRALIFNVKKNGIEGEAAKVNMEPANFIKKYAGRINWLCQLNPDSGMVLKAEFRKVTKPYLTKYPEIDIPELSWNSSIEVPYVATPEDEMVFTLTNPADLNTDPQVPSESPFN